MGLFSNIMKTLLTIVLLLLLPLSVAAQSRLYQGGTGYATSTQGDLLVGTSSALRYSQLPIGANGRILQVDTSVPTLMSWVATSSLGISGVTDHSLLSNLSWASSGHTGTAFNLAGFDSLGAATNYATSALNILISDTVGTLLVPRGGTGATSLTGLLQGNGTSPFTAISNSSTVGQILSVTGASTYAWGALDLTNGNSYTGALPASNGGTGITSLATGIATWLGSGSAVDLRSLTVGTTGSGSLVFATSPTFVTPALGTPASGVATNLTGLPLTTGVTGVLPIANGGTNASSIGSPMLLAFDGTRIVATSTPSATAYIATSTTATSTFAGGLTVDTDDFVVDNGANKVGIGTAELTSADVFKIDAGSGTGHPTFFPGTPTFRTFGVDSTSLVVGYNSWTAASNFIAQRAGGSRATPAATEANVPIFALAGRGYDTTNLYAGGSKVAIDMRSVNAWTSTDNSTQMLFQTTPIGSTAIATNMTIRDSKVGIATSTPWRTLSVTGTGAWSGLTSSGSTHNSVCINGTTKELEENAASSCLVSSKKFKNSIKELKQSGLALVLEMQPVTYYENTDKKRKDPRIGFIAEDVYALEPRLVDLKDGLPHSVRYQEYTAVLTAAIQEQQQEIEDLQKRVKMLDGKGPAPIKPTLPISEATTVLASAGVAYLISRKKKGGTA